eukprot:CAMPEP_0181077964 /NCGR_PEP_ID=MMETSP1071-20121207/1235_1 /TAXON_ID=35127 /ORGANISM="Thalassiosira sp., Strain NH16" /LENGTH=187 /DNA_ID=CAMNT_0023159251 /DNA_START=220 /DNA_END=783 /DNA_ORIENTATION=+
MAADPIPRMLKSFFISSPKGFASILLTNSKPRKPYVSRMTKENAEKNSSTLFSPTITKSLLARTNGSDNVQMKTNVRPNCTSTNGRGDDARRRRLRYDMVNSCSRSIILVRSNRFNSTVTTFPAASVPSTRLHTSLLPWYKCDRSAWTKIMGSSDPAVFTLAPRPSTPPTPLDALLEGEVKIPTPDL